MYRHYQGRSGPHSIHDARQYAWARLVFGPGVPPPNRRPHRGQLPDVPELPIRPRRPSILVRLVRILTLRAVLDPTVSGGAAEIAEATSPGQGDRPSSRGDKRVGADTNRNKSLAA